MENTYNDVSSEEEINTGNDSLDEMLERIRPYLPKTPKAEPVKPGVWKRQDYTYLL